MTGFLGMGMAAQAGGVNAQSLLEMSAASQAAQQASPAQTAQTAQPAQTAPVQPVSTAAGQPAQGTGASAASGTSWTCACGTVNTGKFCMECGSPKPAGAPVYRCSNCGWEPADPHHPPKFCPECGDIFDDGDKQ